MFSMDEDSDIFLRMNQSKTDGAACLQFASGFTFAPAGCRNNIDPHGTTAGHAHFCSFRPTVSMIWILAQPMPLEELLKAVILKEPLGALYQWHC
ncbi:MAG: hypothetical protein R3E96_07450 [Planctomycetota bacterium]